MKAKDLAERDVAGLRELEESLRKDLFKAKFKNFTNQLDDTSSISKTRKEIARVLTVLGQKESGKTSGVKGKHS